MINFSILDRQEEKISRSLNVFCFGEPDYWKKRICSRFASIIKFFGKVFAGETDKCYSILKSHCCNDKAHIVFNLEMAKILKEKGFNDVFLCQKFIQAMCNRV